MKPGIFVHKKSTSIFARPEQKRNHTEEKRYLWVVEMRIDGRWEPTVGVSLAREQGRVELRQWREDNIFDEFRLERYRAEGK
jgi:hypothetical protein